MSTRGCSFAGGRCGRPANLMVTETTRLGHTLECVPTCLECAVTMLRGVGDRSELLMVPLQPYVPGTYFGTSLATQD